jgi:hypothetical protein
VRLVRKQCKGKSKNKKCQEKHIRIVNIKVNYFEAKKYVYILEKTRIGKAD